MKQMIALFCFLILGPLAVAQADVHVPDHASLDELMSPAEIAEELNRVDPLPEEPLYTPYALAPARLQIKVYQAANAQYLDVFVDGEQWARWPVSTGREEWEKAKSGKKYFSRTPKGSWKPTRMYKNHYSRTWQTDMPYAVFFTGGIAIHAANPAVEDKLGNRASGGCVRLLHYNAKLLYELIEDIGKKNTQITVL